MKRRGFLPQGSGLDATAILEYATEELRSYITAFLKGIREEFIIATLDLAVTSGTVTAPARAVGAALRTIGWVLADGRVKPLTRIEPENSGGYSGQSGEPGGYMFQGNNFILLPAPSSGTLRLTYQQRPGQLVLPSACALITDVDAGELTIEATPSDFTDSPTPYDFVSGTPNFNAYAIDFTGEDGDDITWTPTSAILGADPSFFDSIAIGDYICFAGETCIPQIPTEVHDLLAQATASAIANATGSARAGFIADKLEKLEKQMTQILSPRSDGSARVIVSKSRIGQWNGW